MLMLVDSKCPKCRKMVGSLELYRKFDGLFFYVCRGCLNTPSSEQDLLRIGHHYGRQSMVEELQAFVKKVRA